MYCCCYYLCIYLPQYLLPEKQHLPPVQRSLPGQRLLQPSFQSRRSRLHELSSVYEVSSVEYFLPHNFLPAADALHNVHISVFPENWYYSENCCCLFHFRNRSPAFSGLRNMDEPLVSVQYLYFQYCYLQHCRYLYFQKYPKVSLLLEHFRLPLADLHPICFLHS